MRVAEKAKAGVAAPAFSDPQTVQPAADRSRERRPTLSQAGPSVKPVPHPPLPIGSGAKEYRHHG